MANKINHIICFVHKIAPDFGALRYDDRGYIDRGLYNGYVAVPPSSLLHGLDYTDDLLQNIDVHGGITYANDAEYFSDKHNIPKDYWIFGFDTAHYLDTQEKWPREAVEQETKKLLMQLLDLEKNIIVDFRGTKVKAGDTVACIHGRGTAKYLIEGKVLKVNPKTITIEYKRNNGSLFTKVVKPERFIKIR